MPGVRIRHVTARSTVVLVPVMSKPLQVKPDDVCPGCVANFGQAVVHPVKTVHLWLDDSGACIVSEGVLEDLRLAGMPDLEVESGVENPPPLQIGVPREKQDQNGRAIIYRR